MSQDFRRLSAVRLPSRSLILRLTAPAIVALLMIATQSCTRPGTADSGETSSTAVRQVAPGTSFELRPGESVRIGDTGPRLALIAVRQDSRCPSGVQCPWAGDAELLLRSYMGTDSADVVIHTDLEPRSATVGSYELRLESLRPHPVAGRAIPASAYVATLVTVRR